MLTFCPFIRKLDHNNSENKFTAGAIVSLIFFFRNHVHPAFLIMSQLRLNLKIGSFCQVLISLPVFWGMSLTKYFKNKDAKGATFHKLSCWLNIVTYWKIKSLKSAKLHIFRHYIRFRKFVV